MAIAAMLLIALANAAEPPPKALLDYIRDAQGLGLSRDAIRKNALAGGWSNTLIEEAFAAIQEPAAAPAERTSTDVPEGYRIGPGDILQISVWKEPEASVESIIVRSDGKVSLPLIKEVPVAGLTPLDVEKVLMKRFAEMIREPDVTVMVREIHSRKVYLVGAVRTVAPIDLTLRMTVLQAITQAGGLSDYAKRKDIYILRNQNGRQVRLPFNYDAVIKGRLMEQNIYLEPDDTIVVPQ
jgi:polysaccharide export outer membrane protein